MSVDYTHMRRALALDDGVRPEPKSPFFSKLAKANSNQKAYRILMQATLYEFSLLKAVAQTLIGKDVRTYSVMVAESAKDDLSEEMIENIEEIANVKSLEKLVSGLGSMINENDEDYDDFYEALSFVANIADTAPIKHN